MKKILLTLLLLASLTMCVTVNASVEDANVNWKTAINTRHSTKWLFREKYEEPKTLYTSTFTNMREYPNVETGKVNKVLAINTEVKAVADYNGWTQIVRDNGNGEEQYYYIWSNCLSEEKVKVEQPRKQKNTVSNNNSSVTSNTTSNNNNESSSNSANTNTESSNESNTNGEYLGKFKLTAYCGGACCNGQWAGQTASGVSASAGRTVAMAGVPFGTKLLINGHVYVVEDRGTPYGHVDIYFSSHSETSSFGVRYADVYRLN